MAAWAAEELFNSYSDGDLNTLNGGTGWSAAWSADTSVDVQGTTVFEGAKAITGTDNAGTGVSKRVATTAASSGTLYFSVRLPQTTVDFDCAMQEGDANTRFAIKFSNGGQIQLYDNDVAGYVNIQAYSANTWYRVGINWDTGVQANKYRVNVDNGSFTAYKTVVNGTFTDVNNFRIDHSAFGVSDVFYLDSISSTYSFVSGPANLKSYNTNLAANIKSINTNLIANVKSLNTNV